jgi:hypothetical protein
MNPLHAFVRHHQRWLHFGYSCFDRILCRAFIPALQSLGTVVHFLKGARQAPALTPAYFRRISADYHTFIAAEAQQAGVAIVEPPRDVRRADWVAPFFQNLGTRPGLAVILKCRERAPVVVSYPKQGNHLEREWRFVNLYYCYLRDPELGRLFVRLCPYFPFPVEVCLNGHEWLAQQLRRAGVAFRQRDNAFTDCADPRRLQELADAFGPAHLRAALDPLLERWLPFFTPAERAQGYRHRLFLAQVEYCHNLVFHERAAADRLFDRLADLNRTIGRPDKLAVIFGRPQFRPDTRTGQTEVKITRQHTPVLRTGFRQTLLKQYVKDGAVLRTETSCFQLRDLAVPKDVANLPKLRAVLNTSNERYLTAQQDVLATYIDRGQLQQLAQPTVSASGRRTPGLRLDDPRLLALLQALTCVAHLVGHGTFKTADLLADMQRLLQRADYRLSQLRYDLGKLRGKGLVVRRPGTQRYQLSAEGYRLAVLYQKLYHRFYAPLTAGVVTPDPADSHLPQHRRAKLDRLYSAIDQALARLADHLGLVA